ncbi:unnamed protein product, partial [Pleuronectes platessa]
RRVMDGGERERRMKDETVATGGNEVTRRDVELLPDVVPNEHLFSELCSCLSCSHGALGVALVTVTSRHVRCALRNPVSWSGFGFESGVLASVLVPQGHTLIG